MKVNTKILVVRPDRIGDVVLSTPVFEALKMNILDSEITALVAEHVKPVVEHNPFLSGVLTYSPQEKHRGFKGFFRFVSELRKGRYDFVVVLQVQFLVSLAISLARIPQRVGPYSKWYSYLFFNRGFLQRRSRVEMHESDYNLMLLRKLGIRVPTRKYEPLIIVDADAKERMRKVFNEFSFGTDDDPQPFTIVHSGMGGSALNWPTGYYNDLVALMVRNGLYVVLTGSVAEKPMVEGIAKEVQSRPGQSKGQLRTFIGPSSPSGLHDLIGLFSLSQLVVAPSTGPLHIAVALGKSTVSFFSPIKVQSALRWGPYVANDLKHRVLVPGALCGQDFKCAGRKCYYYFCMERLSVEEALSAVLDILKPMPKPSEPQL